MKKFGFEKTEPPATSAISATLEVKRHQESQKKQESRGGDFPEREYQLWFYRLNEQLPGYTRQGLMTTSPAEAQKQLTEIYGKPVTGLHRKERNQ